MLLMNFAERAMLRVHQNHLAYGYCDAVHRERAMFPVGQKPVNCARGAIELQDGADRELPIHARNA